MSLYKSKNIQRIVFAIIGGVGFILGIYIIFDTSIFLLSKKEANALIVDIKKNNSPKPYSVTLKYFNQYENKDIIAEIENIDGSFERSLSPAKNSYVAIYYGDKYPYKVYFSEYSHPNLGYIIIEILFLVIMGSLSFFSIANLRSDHSN